MPIHEPGEEIIMGEHVKFGGKSGYLSLTNRRLIFEHKTGLVTKRTHTFEIPLEAITNATVEGAIFKKLVLVVKAGYISQITSRFEFSVRDPYSWQNKLVRTRKGETI